MHYRNIKIRTAKGHPTWPVVVHDVTAPDAVVGPGGSDNQYITGYHGGNSLQTEYDLYTVAGDYTGGYVKTRAYIRLREFRPDGSLVQVWEGWSSSNHSASVRHFAVNVPGSFMKPDTKYRIDYIGQKAKADSVWVTGQGAYWTTFWTNRVPTQPTIASPANGQFFQYESPDNFDIVWEHNDADLEEDPSPATVDGYPAYDWDYGGWQLEFRRAPTPTNPNPEWAMRGWYDNPSGGLRTRFTYSYVGGVQSTAYNARRMQVRNDYVSLPTNRWLDLGPGSWQIRVRTFDLTAAQVPSLEDIAGVSPWSDPVTVYIEAAFLPPTLLSPIDGEPNETDEVLFEWRFNDPRETGGTQVERQIRIRKVGEEAWVELLDAIEMASADETYLWTNGDGFTIEAGFQYEWQVRTVADPGSHDTNWTGDTAQFWAIPVADSGEVLPTPDITLPDAGLGCGVNRAFVYLRGGKQMVGEITFKERITWGRIRDDISLCDITVRGWDDDCGKLLSALRCWMFEIVVFRDKGDGPERVWEGPITRITWEKDRVSIEAKDVMAYVYRRILRRGYNDAYRKVNGVEKGLAKVTTRAGWIVKNALAYDDPNVLGFLRVVENDDDARQSRVIPAYSRTAWQEVDDLAAKCGLDYVTAGRRIILWDTHRAIGSLPEMRDGDFDQSPIVTEYGMQLANYYAVTNNNGVYGDADRFGAGGTPEYYGYIEMLVSAWGEADGGGTAETLTGEARQRLVETLSEQAERGIAQRWPTPVQVRVPDNSTLNPDLNITINQLVPGVHIPLRSDSTLREIVQIQKLDRLTVTEDASGEKVQVVMSPAPLSRDEDPDEEGGEE